MPKQQYLDYNGLVELKKQLDAYFESQEKGAEILSLSSAEYEAQKSSISDGTYISIIDDNEITAVIDDKLSEVSENPVQNKIISQEITSIKSDLSNLPLVNLYVNYDSSLAGATITATNGTESHTATATSSGQTIINGKKLGTWTITESTYSTSATVNTVYYGNYSATVGGDRFITVTYDSAFEGTTITCSNGTDTQTRSASGGSVVFCFASDGTFTISGVVSGTTYTTSVVVSGAGNYSANLQTNITLNLTIYSASNDTVYYIENGSNVTLCTTNANGSASATLVIPTSGKTLTLYSSVAKKTDDKNTPFSKSITFTSNTQTVLVMPDKALYWYGNECAFNGTGGWGTGYRGNSARAGVQFTKNTNSMSAPHSDGDHQTYTLNRISYANSGYVFFTYSNGGMNTNYTCVNIAKTTEDGYPFFAVMQFYNVTQYGSFTQLVDVNDAYRNPFAQDLTYSGTTYLYGVWLE